MSKRRNLKSNFNRSKKRSDMSFIFLTFFSITFFSLFFTGFGLSFNPIIITLLSINTLILTFSIKLYSSMYNNYIKSHNKFREFKLA